MNGLTGGQTGVVSALARAQVLVVGDVMLDRYLYGAVDRISPEAPVPVLTIGHETAMLGGAGNVLRNLTALGARAGCLGVVGDDGAGAQVRELAALEAGLACQVLVQAGRHTVTKVRFVAAGQQLLRCDREPPGEVDAGITARLLAEAEAIMAETGTGKGLLILSDYGKGVLTTATVPALIGAARAAGWPVVVDPTDRDYAVYRGADLVTPNRRELAAASGLPVGTDDEVRAACRAVIESAGVGGVLATRGEQGMSLLSAESGRNGGALHLPARVREVLDVSGAGDTAVAVLGAAMAAGARPPRAARLANVAAGIAVGKPGTAAVRPDELGRALRGAEARTAEAKIVGRARMLRRAARWRASGLRVGFANGCFDLLHPGHVSLLAQARRACDRLVVGLNGDASVRRLKGGVRPVQSAPARAAILASLADVSLVVVFEEDTPVDLLEALRPEVLVKGAEYPSDRIAGADLVRRYGGQIVLAEMRADFSTTRTLEKLSG